VNESGHQWQRPDPVNPPDTLPLAEVTRRTSKGRQPATFTERDITRAIKGATTAKTYQPPGSNGTARFS